jgi:hypothetical protein
MVPILIDLETFCRRARLGSYVEPLQRAPRPMDGMLRRLRYSPESTRGSVEDLRWSPMYEIVFVRDTMSSTDGPRVRVELRPGGAFGAGISPKEAEMMALTSAAWLLRRMSGVVTFEQWAEGQEEDEHRVREFDDDVEAVSAWRSFFGPDLVTLLMTEVDLEGAPDQHLGGPRVDIADDDPDAQPRPPRRKAVPRTER